MFNIVLIFLLFCLSAFGQPLTLNDPALIATQQPPFIFTFPWGGTNQWGMTNGYYDGPFPSPLGPAPTNLVLWVDELSIQQLEGGNNYTGTSTEWPNLAYTLFSDSETTWNYLYSLSVAGNGYLQPLTNLCVGALAATNEPYSTGIYAANFPPRDIFTNGNNSSYVPFCPHGMICYIPGSNFINGSAYTVYSVAEQTNIAASYGSSANENGGSRIVTFFNPDATNDGVSTGDYTTTNGWAAQCVSGGATNDETYFNSQIYDGGKAFCPTNFSYNQFYIFVSKFQGASSNATTTAFTIIGGVPYGVTNYGNGGCTHINSDAVCIGGGTMMLIPPYETYPCNDYSDGFNGSIAEVIIYSRLTDGTIGIGTGDDAAIITYLRTKYHL
jgi:hypothetical protein